MSSYTNTELLDAIRRVADLSTVDGTPSKRTFDEYADISASTVVRRFGSWGAAVEEAGLDPTPSSDKIPRAELVAELCRLRDELDQIPTADQMDSHGAYAYITYYERFGSWTDALTEVFGDVPDREWDHVSDATLIADLRRLASDDGERPTTTAVEEDGAHAVATYRDRFGSWPDALEAAGFEPPSPQGVTTETLLAEVRQLHDEFGGRPTTTVVREHGTHSIQTYYDRFESWDNVLAAAFETVPAGERDAADGHTQPPAKQYTDAELCAEIRRAADVADSDGAPSVSEFNEYSSIADTTISRRFGSWNAGVEHAGFEPHQSEPVIPDDELSAELRRLRDTIGQLPTVTDMDEQGAYSPSTYQNRFGSWTDALVETFDDVSPPLTTRQSDAADQGPSETTGQRVSDGELLTDLQTLADELGQTPTAADMRDHGAHSTSTYSNRFGSWNAAIEAADLDSSNQNTISDGELIADLHRLRDKLGETPTSTDVAQEGTYGLATYQRRFGSWSEAAAAAFDDTDT